MGATSLFSRHGTQNAEGQNPNAFIQPAFAENEPEDSMQIQAWCYNACSVYKQLVPGGLLPAPTAMAVGRGGHPIQLTAASLVLLGSMKHVCPNRAPYPPSVEPSLSALADVRVTCPLSSLSSL